MTNTTVEYAEYNLIRDEWLRPNPALHIPRWPYLKSEDIEVIAKGYSFILSGSRKESTLNSVQAHEKRNDRSVFDWMRLITHEIIDPGLMPYFGFLSYELNQQVSDSIKVEDIYQIADYYLLFPSEMLIINHSKKDIQINTSNHPAIDLENETGPVRVKKDVRFHEPESSYLSKIEHISSLITEGEVYQINYTSRLSAHYEGSGYRFFEQLYKRNAAPFSVYARLPHCEIISNSPERFLAVTSQKVITEPIKGTAKRYTDPDRDRKAILDLLGSEKDAAELSMIVDLLRNDLSKVCKPGTVEVVEHKRLETFENVHHLVSTIKGILLENYSYIDLFEAALPGGSISGCPKSAALKYIRKLEKSTRSFYTGSFFISGLRKKTMDSNILIRTGILKQDQLHFQVGSGIVIDSNPADEYAECMAKADSFIKTVKALAD